MLVRGWVPKYHGTKPSPPQKLGMRCQLVMLAGIPEGMRTVLFLSVYHASGENLALRLLMAEEDWAEEGGPKDIRHRNESGWHRPVKAPPPVVVAMQLGLVWHELYDTSPSTSLCTSALPDGLWELVSTVPPRARCGSGGGGSG